MRDSEAAARRQPAQHEPAGRRPLRLRMSLATRIFAGLLFVMAAFGASTLYALVELHRLHDNAVVLRESVAPLQEGTASLFEKVRAMFSQVRPARDLAVVRDRAAQLAKEDLFGELAHIEDDALELSSYERLGRRFQQAMDQLAREFHDLRRGSRFFEVLRRRGLPSQVAEELARAGYVDDVPNEALFRTYVQVLSEDASTGLPDAVRRDQAALRFMLQRVVRRLRGLRLHIERAIDVGQQAALEQERSAVLAATGATIGALVVSLLVVVWVQRSLRRIGQLIAGVRRLAEGSYDEPLVVSGNDEVADLAAEFNRMVERLRERDRLVAKQRDELLRAERLATVGRVSAQITHEIRNPLSSIGLNAEMLLEELQDAGDAVSEESRELAAAIQREVDRLKEITEQYLQFARGPRVDPRDEDLGAIVDQLVQFVREDLRSRGVGVRAHHPAAGRLVARVDRRLVWQALLNLIHNAAEAMPEGGSVDLDLWAEGNWAIIAVRDTGCGIAPEDRERIFDPFFTTKEGGTGLGLPVVREIVLAHGGTIQCVSTPDGGTEFRTRWPRVKKAHA